MTLMNYPFRTAALSYLLGRSEDASPYGAEDFREAMETIRENYPRPAFYSAMNLLGTHDTPRLEGGPLPPEGPQAEEVGLQLPVLPAPGEGPPVHGVLPATGGTSIYLTLPWPEEQAEDALTGRRFPAEGGMLHLPLPPLSGMLLV